MMTLTPDAQWDRRKTTKEQEKIYISVIFVSNLGNNFKIFVTIYLTRPR